MYFSLSAGTGRSSAGMFNAGSGDLGRLRTTAEVIDARDLNAGL
jgi:hypothetical protein